MLRPQLSILGMAGAIAFVAVALACLLHASAPWASIAGFAYFSALATAPIGVACCGGRRRIFWIGFSAWIWSFLAITILPGTPGYTPSTTRLLGWVYERMIPTARTPEGAEELTRLVTIPRAVLHDGATFEELGALVDIHAEAGPLVKGAQVLDKRVAGVRGGSVPFMVQLKLRLDLPTAALLEKSVKDRSKLFVSRHRPARFSQLSALSFSPPVDRPSFDQVGQAILGILAGLTGGLVARRISASPEAQLGQPAHALLPERLNDDDVEFREGLLGNGGTGHG